MWGGILGAAANHDQSRVQRLSDARIAGRRGLNGSGGMQGEMTRPCVRLSGASMPGRGATFDGWTRDEHRDGPGMVIQRDEQFRKQSRAERRRQMTSVEQFNQRLKFAEIIDQRSANFRSGSWRDFDRTQISVPWQVPVRSGGSAIASFGRTWASRIFFRPLIRRGTSLTSATARLLSTTNRTHTTPTRPDDAANLRFGNLSSLSSSRSPPSLPQHHLLPRAFPPHRAPAINQCRRPCRYRGIASRKQPHHSTARGQA